MFIGQERQIPAFLSWCLVSASLMWQFSRSYEASWTKVSLQNLTDATELLLQACVRRIMGSLGHSSALCSRLDRGSSYWSRMDPEKSDNPVNTPGVWLRARRACGNKHIYASNGTDQTGPSSSIHSHCALVSVLTVPLKPIF